MYARFVYLYVYYQTLSTGVGSRFGCSHYERFYSAASSSSSSPSDASTSVCLYFSVIWFSPIQINFVYLLNRIENSKVLKWRYLHRLANLPTGKPSAVDNVRGDNIDHHKKWNWAVVLVIFAHYLLHQKTIFPNFQQFLCRLIGCTMNYYLHTNYVFSPFLLFCRE